MQRFITLTILIIYSLVIISQNKSGGTNDRVSLDSVVVYGKTVGAQLRTTADGTMLWNMSMMNNLPKILGNADPLHYAQMLPGVSTNGEYDAGFHVLGCETSHNNITIDGAPIYGVSHLLGIFSVFNASHFQQMLLSKNATHGKSNDFLGAEVNMQTFYQPTDSVTGEFAVGLISSQGTIRIPVTRKSELAVSLRGSYLNLLYKNILQGDESTLKYSFNDANVTYNHILNDRNRLRFNFYIGNDKASMDESAMASTIELKWKNLLASLDWLYDDGRVKMADNVYYTQSNSEGVMDMMNLNVKLPSLLSEVGNKFSVTWKNWRGGVDFSAYHVTPQIPEVNSSFYNLPLANPKRDAFLISPYIEKVWDISDKVSATTGLRGNVYIVGHANNCHLSPSFSLQWQPHRSIDVSLGYSYRHQYLTKTGMSSINTPLEFWLPAGTFGLKPQTAHSIDFSSRYIFPGGEYAVSVEAYSKWLTNQTEYNGTIYSFVSSRYNLESMLLNGKGHNYGFNIILSKRKGWFTGWLAYAYSKAFRTYNTEVLSGTFPSSHDRPHEINGVLTFHIGKRWDIGFTGVWASGTPFTAPKQYYLLNRFLIAEFAEHNSNRLRSYLRFDGSVNYHLRSTRRIHEQGLNLSVYNLSASDNDIFYYMKVSDTEYKYKRMSFFMRVLPSISYYIKF